MMADRPLFGFGWDRPVPVYNQYYRATRLTEAQAIEVNDYLSIGTILGLPALACFAAGVGLHLRRRSAYSVPVAGENGLLRAACRAGVVALLIGFWFDGGLFKPATGLTFWVLLELGSSRVLANERTGDG